MSVDPGQPGYDDDEDYVPGADDDDENDEDAYADPDFSGEGEDDAVERKMKRRGGGQKHHASGTHDKPVCKYGAQCYRKNPQHLTEFYHPPRKPALPSPPLPPLTPPRKDPAKRAAAYAGFAQNEASSTAPEVKRIKLDTAARTGVTDEDVASSVTPAPVLAAPLDAPDEEKPAAESSRATVDNTACLVPHSPVLTDDDSADDAPVPLARKMTHPNFDAEATQAMVWEAVALDQVPPEKASEDITPPLSPAAGAETHCVVAPMVKELQKHASNIFSPVTPTISLPLVYEDKWDAMHVRLPCSARFTYTRPFPNPDRQLSMWYLMQAVLSTPIGDPGKFQEAVFAYAPHLDQFEFNTLTNFFDAVATPDEYMSFFQVTLPMLTRLALRLPEICPHPISLLTPKKPGHVELTRLQVGCLLAAAFLCMFPRQGWIAEDENAEAFLSLSPADRHLLSEAQYPRVNFFPLFSSIEAPVSLCQANKLRCFVHYFNEILAAPSEVQAEVITFERQVLSAKPDWAASAAPFTPVTVDESGNIEDAADHLLVDFANKYVGGGVLGKGCLQEEIMFTTHPELTVAMLFCARLSPDECLRVYGARRFARYSGYGDSFRFAGGVGIADPLEKGGRFVCMDAAVFGQAKQMLQYHEDMLLRELNKCYCAFCDPADGLPIATGNWGCGNFGGYHDLKAVLQLMAAAEAGRPLSYHTFGVEGLGSALRELSALLVAKHVTVGQVWAKLRAVAASTPSQPPQLFNILLDHFE
eukprot:TRINITY_DN3805_c0_g2_i2.p1 TRINITY_DN3805_c0_g2~~TRINITY_DN3805_c0_g2_i2.p1  ORF type:complete len:756 (+),score=180.98 TRINITY_DN3805_c0_g2_i2:3299-5566(+)